MKNLIIGIMRANFLKLFDPETFEKRLQTVEQSKKFDEVRWVRLEQRLENIENNLVLYREDSQRFQDEIKKENLIFRQEMKTENEAFRQEMKTETQAIRQEMDKRFEQVDKRFEQIDARFERLDYQLMDIHKAITRMTVFFISGIAIIGTILTIVDKLWQP